MTYSIPNLRDRIAYARPRVDRTVPGTIGPSRGEYRRWNENSMEEAVSAIEKGMTVRRAAEMYRVPRSTLHDHFSGRVKYGVKSGPSQYLTTAEEEELASFLMETSRIGYPHTKNQILTIVQQILESKGIKEEVTEGWWQGSVKGIPV